jgi:hypothetical protein
MKTIANNLSILQWLFAGVIFVIVDKVNDKYFKNRDVNLQEMTFNDRYVQTIMAKDNYGEQMELAKYYACLSVQPEVRNGWIKYYQLKQNEFQKNEIEIKKLQDSILNLKFDANGNARDSLNDKEEFLLGQLNDKLNYKENQQTAKTVPQATVIDNSKARRIYIQYDKDVKDTAISYQKLFNLSNWKAPGIERRDDIKSSSIRYFYQDDISLANELQSLINRPTMKTIYVSGFEGKVPAGQLEIWLDKTIKK